MAKVIFHLIRAFVLFKIEVGWLRHKEKAYRYQCQASVKLLFNNNEILIVMLITRSCKGLMNDNGKDPAGFYTIFFILSQ